MSVTWINAVSGDWANGANWSGGVPPGSGDSAVVSTPGAYTITISSPDLVSSLAFSDPGAILDVASAFAVGGTVTLVSGELLLEAGARLEGGTLALDGGALQVAGTITNPAVLDGVSVAGDLTVNGGFLALVDGASVTGHLTLVDGSLELQGDSDLVNSTTLLGGSLYDSNAPSSPPGTLTIDRGVGIDGYGAVAGTPPAGPYASDTPIALDNQGSIIADVLGGTLTVEPSGSFTNEGTLGATNGGTLLVNDSVLSTSGTGAVNIAEGGAVQFDGSVDGSQTVTFADDSGTLRLEDAGGFDASIAGFAPGDVIDIAGEQVASVSYSVGILTALDGSDNTLATLAMAGNYGDDLFSVASDGSGGSDITVAAQPIGMIYQWNAFDEFDSGGRGGDWYANPELWNTNPPPDQPTAVVDVTGNGDLLGLGTGENATVGSLILAAGADLQIQGALTIAGTLSVGSGTVEIGGTLIGGTLDGSAGSIVVDGGILDGVTVEGGVAVLGSATFIDGTSVSASDSILVTAPVYYPLASLDLEGTGPLTEAATVTLGNGILTATDETAVAAGTASTLTIAPGALVEGNGSISDNASGPVDLVNEGAIMAEGPGALTIATSGGFTNDGAIGAADGGTLVVGAAATNGAGAIDIASAGTVQLDGSLAATQTVNFEDGTGTLVLAPGAGTSFTISGFQPGDRIVLDGIQSYYSYYANGVLTVQDASTGNPDASFTLTGNQDYAGGYYPTSYNPGYNYTTVSFDGPPAGLEEITPSNDLFLYNSATFQSELLDAGGLIATGGNSSDNFTITIGPTGSLDGWGQVDNYFANSLALDNQGTIDADAPGQYLLLDPTTVTNEGLIEAQNGGTLYLEPSFATITSNGGAGTIAVASSGTVVIYAPVNSTQSFVFEDGTGELDIAEPSSTFDATIVGFRPGDTLDVDAFLTSVSFSDGILTGYEFGTPDLALNLAGNYAGDTFSVGSDGQSIVVSSTLPIGTIYQWQGGSGDWDAYYNWSGYNVPSDDPTGYAVISGAGDLADINYSNFTIGSALINAAGGGLTINGNVFGLGNEAGSLTVEGTLTIDAGVLTLNYGSLIGGKLDAVPGSLSVQDATLQNVAVEGNLSLSGSVSLEGTTVYSDQSDTTLGTITLTTPAGANTSLLIVEDNQPALGQTVVLEGGNLTAADPDSDFVVEQQSATSGTLIPFTITAGGTVTGYGGITNLYPFEYQQYYTWAPQDPVDLENQGQIDANSPGQALLIETSGFTNDGLIEATDGGTLTLSNVFGLSVWQSNVDGSIAASGGSTVNLGTAIDIAGTTTITDSTLTIGDGSRPSLGWSNSGTIVAVDSTINLQGSFSDTDIGTIDRAGGSLQLAGTLNNAGGTLDASTTSLLGATLDGGTIDGGTVDIAGLGLSFSGNADNALDGVTVLGNLTVAAGEDVALGDGTTVSGAIDVAGTLNLDGSVSLTQTVTLDGGTLAGVDNIAASGVIEGYGDVNSNVANDGTIDADTPSQTLELYDGLTNDGLAEATNGGTLLLWYDGNATGSYAASGGSTLYFFEGYNIEGNITLTGGSTLEFISSGFVNTGVITATDSTINIFATITVADLGTINRTNSALIISGTLDNSGTLDASTTVMRGATLSGTIVGGSLDQAGLRLVFAGGTLNHVQVIGNLSATGSVTLEGGTTVTGNISIGSDATVTLLNYADFTQSETLAGGGLALTQSGQGAPAVTTIDAGVVISGYGVINPTLFGFGTNYDFTSGDIDNKGTLSATVSGRTLLVDPAAFTNDAMVEAASGGTLSLDVFSIYQDQYVVPTVINARDGTISGSSGTVDIGSNFTNHGLVEATGGSLTLQPGELGFTPQSTNAADGIIDGTNAAVGLLDLNANLGSIDISGGSLTLANPTSWTNAGSVVSSYAAVTLSGSFGNTGIVTVTGGSLTLGSQSAWSNTGTISTDGAAVDLGGMVTMAGLGSFTRTGGSVALSGTLDLGGGTVLTSSGLLQGLTLAGGTLENGTVIEGPGGQLGLSGNGAVLDNVAVDGNLTANGTSFQFAGGTSVSGTIFLNASTLDLENEGTLAGNVVLSNSSLNVSTTNELIVPASAIVSGSGTISANGIENEGLIDANVAGSTLHVLAANIVNAGTMLAENGGVLDLANYYYQGSPPGETWTNSADATIATTDGTLELGGNFANAGVISETNGTLYLGGADNQSDLSDWQNSGQISATRGTVYLGASNFGNDGADSWTNTGTIALDDTTAVIQGQFDTGDFGDLSRTGGSISLEGSIDNAGRTLDLTQGAFADLALVGATITGGTVIDSAAHPIEADGSDIFSGVTIEGGLSVAGQGGTLVLTGGSSFTGPVAVADVSVDLGSDGDLAAPVTLNGGTLYASGANLAIASGVEVSGSGSLGLGSADVTNDGTLAATQGTLAVSGVVTNGGVVEAENGAILQLGQSVSNVVNSPGNIFYDNTTATLTGGTYVVGAGSEIVLGGNYGILTATNADITLNGTGSTLLVTETGDMNDVYPLEVPTSIDNSLDTLETGGILDILGGRGWNGSFFGSWGAFTDEGAIVLGGGTFEVGTLTLASGATFSGYGALEEAHGSPIENAGTITASGGTLDIASPLAGGQLVVADGATLEISQVISGGTVSFATGSGTLQIVTPSAFSDSIAGLTFGDVIDVKATVTSTQINGSTLTLLNGTTTVASYIISGNLTNRAFVPTADGHGGTDLTLSTSGVAVPVVVTANPILYQPVHVGTPDQTTLSISNGASSGSDGLDVGVGSVTGGAFGSGAITSLAPGQTNHSSVVVELNTATAGATSGTVALSLSSDGTKSNGGVPLGFASDVLTLSGAVYRYANGFVVPLSETLPLGGSSGTVQLLVENTAPADGYSEGLIAEITGVSGQGFGASIGEETGTIAAGGFDATSLSVSAPTGQAGTVSGSVTLDLTSVPVAGGLASSDLGTVMVPLAVTVDNAPQAALLLAGGVGTLAGSGGSYTLNLGTFAESAGSVTADIAVQNVAAAPADLLTGDFILPSQLGSPFTNTGFGPLGLLPAGNAPDLAPSVSFSTGAAGNFSETITLDPSDGTFTGIALSPITLTVTGSVVTLEPPASFSIAPLPSPLAVDIGGTVSLAITNTAEGLGISEALIASVTSTTGAVTASLVNAGDIAAGTSGDLILGFDTSTAGPESGTVTLDFKSDGSRDGRGLFDLGSVTIDVEGTVDNPAAATFVKQSGSGVIVQDPEDSTHETLDLGTVSQNSAPLSVNLGVLNDAAGPAESLSGTFSLLANAQFTNSGFGPTGILGGDAEDTAPVVTLATNQLGTFSETATLDWQGLNGSGNHTETLTVIGTVASSGATITGPSAEAIFPAEPPTPISGIALQNFDPSATITVSVSDGTGTLSASGSGVTAASGDQALTIVGTEAAVNAELGTLSYASDAPGSDTIAVAASDAGGDNASFNIAVNVQPPPVLPPANAVQGSSQGDVHLTTFDGLYYNFQAVGEFVLARSTKTGNSFAVEIRTAPYGESQTVSVITQIAAQVGTDSVTFDAARAQPVWVDGSAVALGGAGSVLQLNGGTLTELTPTAFRLSWNTGESMEITNSGGYLNIPTIALGPQGGPGSVQGLLGSDSGQVNDFQLADGAVLPQPLDSATLYGAFADAWRIPAGTQGLFDYPVDENTDNFTDTSFPATAISLASLPQSLVQQAQQAAIADGITDPGLLQGAIIDYIETGDASALGVAALTQQQGISTSTASITGGSAAASLGVGAAEASVTEAEAGATAVTFDVFLTAALSSDTVIDYGVIDTAPGDLGAAALGGALPSGSLTISAGTLEGQFIIDLPQAALAGLPTAGLEVEITGPSGTPISASQARTLIVNNQPVAGAAAVAEILPLGEIGSLSRNGSAETLALGTLIEGEHLPTLQFAVANEGSSDGDQLGGSFAISGGAGFEYSGDTSLDPIAGGAAYQGLLAAAATGTLGNAIETITLDPTDENASGYSAVLPTETLTITDTVIAPAAVQLGTPATVKFGNVRIGETDADTLAVTNTASSGSASLDVGAVASGAAIASGAIGGLAAGAADTSSISLGLDTATAGALSGTVTLGIASDAGDGNTLALPSQQISLSGSVYREASAALGSGGDTIVHVGDQIAQTLSIANTAAADGYSENLIATVMGATGGVTTSTGGTGDIAAGAGGALTLGFSTAQAGTIAGSVTLELQSDGTGIDGLPLADLGQQTVAVNATVNNYAVAQLHEVSGGGAWQQSGNSYTLSLGNVELGASPITVALEVVNNVAGPADLLSGTFVTSGPSAFALSGFGAFSGLAAGQSDATPSVTLSTAAAGQFSETITLDPNGSNASGYSTALAPETLTVTGTVAALAQPVVNTTSPVALGNVRVGGTLSQALSLSNDAPPGGEALDASVSGATGNATGSGTIALLGAGRTDTSDIRVGLTTTASGGPLSGTVTLGFLSDGTGTDGNGQTALTSATVSVTGAAYNEAAPEIVSLPQPFIVHVGQSVTQALTIENTAPADGYSENLSTTITGTTGGVTASGSPGEIVAGGSSSAIMLSFPTAKAGTVSGGVTLSFGTDGTGIDGLGALSLGSETVVVNATVDNYAATALQDVSGGGTWTKKSATSYTLSLGTVARGTTPLTVGFGVANGAVGPADLLSGNFSASSTSGFTVASLAAFSGLAAGQADEQPTVTFNTGTGGTFTETITVSSTGSNGSGYSGALAPVALTITGTVATSSTWAGSTGSLSGSWNLASNWSGSLVPTSLMAAVISKAGTYTVTSGQSNSAGTLTLSNGSATLAVAAGTFSVLGSSTNAGTIAVGDGAALALTGTMTNSRTIALDAVSNATALEIAGSATLGGSGSVTLGGATAAILSNGQTATLTNSSTISGAGTIGDSSLSVVNSSGHVIDANNAAAGLTLTGRGFGNSGLIEATGGAALTIASTTITGGTIAASGGTVALSGSTIAGGTLNASGGTIATASGTSTLSGTTSTGTVAVADGTALAVEGTITNNGTVALAGTGEIEVKAATTLKGSGSVSLGSASAAILSAGSAVTLTNDATIAGAGTIGDGSLSLVNSTGAVIDATGTTALTLAAKSVSNAAIIEATASGGLVIATTVTQSTGGVISAAGGNLLLAGATLTGDTLTTSNGGTIATASGTSTLSGTTSTGTIAVADGTALAVEGTITNNGTVALAGAGEIEVKAATTLKGSGSVSLGSASAAILSAGSAVTLTNDATIAGAGTIGDGSLSLVNSTGAVIDATGTTALTLAAKSVSNAAIIEATASGGLVIATTVTQSTGGVISAAGGNLLLAGATLTGDTLTTSNGGTIATASGTSTLSGTTSTGTIAVADGTALALEGTITNNGKIALNASGQLVVATNTTLKGSGSTITLGDAAGNAILGGGTAVTLTNDGTIAGSGTIGNSLLSVVNSAGSVIDATGANAALTLAGAKGIANAALIEATGHAGLVIATTITQSTGGVISAAGGNVLLEGATLNGDTLTTSGGGVIETVSGANTFSGATSSGTIDVSSGTALTLKGTITDTGVIAIASSSVQIASAVSLNGSGAVTMTDAAANAIVSNGTTETVTNNATIAGSGTIGDKNLTLVNGKTGTIDASGTSAGLTISDTSHAATNAGVIEATGSAGLTVTGALTNSGSLVASEGTLDVAGAVTGTGSATISGGTLEFGSSVAKTQAVTFAPSSSGLLDLGAAQSFAGTVAGLGIDNAIDLQTFAFSGGPSVTAVTQLLSGGTAIGAAVTIKDGSLTATVDLLNQAGMSYSNTGPSSYQLVSDGALHPGTLFELAGSQVT